MLPLNDKSRIILFHKPINFHKGFDSLSHIVQTELKLVLIPNLFILFSNRRKNRIKILYHDGHNLLLTCARFEKALDFKHQEGVVFNELSFKTFLTSTNPRRSRFHGNLFEHSKIY